MIFTATFICEGTGLVFRGLVVGRASENTCFDLYISMDDSKRDHSVYLDYIAQNIPVEKSVLYQVYLSGSSQVLDYVNSHVTYYNYSYEQDPILRCSDYDALRSIAGYPPVELKKDQYLIHCMTYLEDALKEYRKPLVLGETELAPGNIYTEHLAQGGWNTNGRGYILVVPDEAAEGLSIHHRTYAAKTLRPVSQDQYEAMTYLHNEIVDWTEPQDYITTKAREEAQVASQTALTIFPLYYLALALTMTAAAILTIQQLSESAHYKRQFLLLHKLGMDRREMAKALRTQFTIYYAMPAVPPILIGVPFILDLARAPEPGVMTGAASPAVIIGSALAIFFLIYAVYILSAYTGLKKNVLPESC